MRAAHPTSVRYDLGVWIHAAALAERDGILMSEVCNTALREWVERKKPLQ